MRTLGLHLEQDRRRAGAAWPSGLAEVDSAGTLVRLDTVDDDAGLVAAVAGACRGGTALLVVDAPFVVPTADGRRDVERVLAWCDIACFPVARRRLVALTGGVRGEELAPALRATGAELWEGSPDQVLRQLMWEGGPGRDGPVPLQRYRELWPALRPPRYRPKAAGRAHSAGLLPAWSLLAGSVDLAGWAPDPAGDDIAQIADAARIDAICMALLAHRRRITPPAAVGVGTADRGRMLIATGPELAARLEATLVRMRGAGEIAI